MSSVASIHRRRDVDRAVRLVRLLRSEWPSSVNVKTLPFAVQSGRDRTDATLEMLQAYGVVRRSVDRRRVTVPPPPAGVVREVWLSARDVSGAFRGRSPDE